MTKNKLERIELIQVLRDLQTDEFNPKQAMYLTKKELISAIV